MLSTIFKPSNENSTVKQLVSHMLSNMNFSKYQKFLQRASSYPQQDHKFVLLEYVESSCDALISRSERLPGTKISIHSLIQNPDFDANMKRLFGEADSWYTRRKIDYSKPVQDQLSDTRQLVLLIKQESDDNYSDMPALVSAPVVNNVILNPEDHYLIPPPLIPLSPYNFNGIGLNQTMWSPYSYNFTYPTMHALS